MQKQYIPKKSKKSRSISGFLILVAVIFFYLPAVIIGLIFSAMLRHEEDKVNLSIIERGVTIFENSIHEKQLSLQVSTIALSREKEMEQFITERNTEDLNLFLQENEYSKIFHTILILDKQQNVIYPPHFKEQIDTGFMNNGKSWKIHFVYNQFTYHHIQPIRSRNPGFVLYTQFSVSKNEIKNMMIADINYSIIENTTGLRIFSTFDKMPEEKIVYKNTNRSQVKQFKTKFFYKYFHFKQIPELSNFFIEAVISPELYRFRVDKLFQLSGVLIVLWILASILFFVFVNYNIVDPIRKLLKASEEISGGNYRERIEINLNTEIGLLAKRFNSMAQSLQKKQDAVDNANQQLEKKVIHRTKSLKTALEKLRNYDNQKNDLFYSIIHDLKNPMTVITGYVNMILQYQNITDEKRKDYLTKILKESNRLINMLNDFLKTIREENSIENMEMVRMNVEPLLEYFYMIYEVQAKEMQIDFVWNVQSPLPDIRGNREKLEHVLSNLLSNAFKFVNERGMVLISARIEDDLIKIGISDTGPGIQEGKEKEIFDKFKKFKTETNENQSGAGLGLFIARQIMKKHKGMIWVSNNNGGIGCTFFITLPIFKE